MEHFLQKSHLKLQKIAISNYLENYESYEKNTKDQNGSPQKMLSYAIFQSFYCDIETARNTRFSNQHIFRDKKILKYLDELYIFKLV